MTASDSLPPIDDELLSAYLDEELSVAERARVEQRLTTDEAARRLLDELRSLRTTLKQLPAEHPDPGLQAAIQRRIAEVQPTLPADDAYPRSQRGARRWTWAGLAIAAALLLAIYLPEEQASDLAEVDRLAKPPREADGSELQLESLARDEGAVSEPERFAEPAATPPPLAEAREADPEPALAEEEAALAMDTRRSAPAPAASGFGMDRRRPSTESGGIDAGMIPVVEVTFAARGATFADFHRLLSDNQIDLRETDAESPDHQLVLEQQRAVQAQLGYGYRDGEVDDAAPEDVVLIEATPAQVEQVLSEVHRDQDTYQEVAIRDAASGGYGGRSDDAPTDAWRQYARGGAQEALAAPSAPVEPRQKAARQQQGDGRLQRQAATAKIHERTTGDSAARPRGWAYRIETPTARQAEQPRVGRSPANVEPPASLADEATPRIQVLFLLQSPQQQ